MNYSYVGSGTVKTGGCAIVEKYAYIEYKWGENSTLYVKEKAEKGILERVVIKRVILNSNAKTFLKVIPIYQDTLNSLYNENDLIVECDARNLATAYWEARQAALAALNC
jgi:hypothetical protein